MTAKGVRGVAVREQLARVVSQTNGCEYCVSAHSFFARRADGRCGHSQGGPPNLKGAMLAMNPNTLRSRIKKLGISRARRAGWPRSRLILLSGRHFTISSTRFRRHRVIFRRSLAKCRDLESHRDQGQIVAAVRLFAQAFLPQGVAIALRKRFRRRHMVCLSL